MDDLPAELSKRMSRRQFLFGGNRGDGGGALPLVVGLGASGMAVVGWGSPAKSVAGDFYDEFVRLFPANNAQRTIEPSAGGISLFLKGTSGTGGILGLVTPPGQLSAVSVVDENLVGLADILTYNRTTDILTILNAVSNIDLTTPTLSSSLDEVNQQWTYSFPDISPKGAGAQVGLPTGTAGTASGILTTSLHRHAFSGRFSKAGHIRDASLGGATPAKFTRIISNNNWTLRRISVYALTAPAGTGSDTYGVVNAAGTLQGTAVSLAVGAVENATALQVTNLTGGTIYYIAVTARATTPALDANVELEYTMNV